MSDEKQPDPSRTVTPPTEPNPSGVTTHVAEDGPASSGSDGADDPFGFRVVHHSVARKDALPKVTGRAVYAADIHLPNMAYAKLVRSP